MAPERHGVPSGKWVQEEGVRLSGQGEYVEAPSARAQKVQAMGHLTRNGDLCRFLTTSAVCGMFSMNCLGCTGRLGKWCGAGSNWNLTSTTPCAAFGLWYLGTWPWQPPRVGQVRHGVALCPLWAFWPDCFQDMLPSVLQLGVCHGCLVKALAGPCTPSLRSVPWGPELRGFLAMEHSGAGTYPSDSPEALAAGWPCCPRFLALC